MRRSPPKSQGWPAERVQDTFRSKPEHWANKTHREAQVGHLDEQGVNSVEINGDRP